MDNEAEVKKLCELLMARLKQQPDGYTRPVAKKMKELAELLIIGAQNPIEKKADKGPTTRTQDGTIKKANEIEKPKPRCSQPGKCKYCREDTSGNCSLSYAVYLITCPKCKIQYVGETEQLMKDRWDAHRRAWNNPTVNSNKDSAFSKHRLSCHPESPAPDLIYDCLHHGLDDRTHRKFIETEEIRNRKPGLNTMCIVDKLAQKSNGKT